MELSSLARKYWSEKHRIVCLPKILVLEKTLLSARAGYNGWERQFDTVCKKEP